MTGGRQRGFWPAPMSRAELDAWRPDVGDRVWCGGVAYVVDYVNADGSVGVAYDGKPPAAPQKQGPRR